jgi:hypothetical protein
VAGGGSPSSEGGCRVRGTERDAASGRCRRKLTRRRDRSIDRMDRQARPGTLDFLLRRPVEPNERGGGSGQHERRKLEPTPN